MGSRTFPSRIGQDLQHESQARLQPDESGLRGDIVWTLVSASVATATRGGRALADEAAIHGDGSEKFWAIFVDQQHLLELHRLGATFLAKIDFDGEHLVLSEYVIDRRLARIHVRIPGGPKTAAMSVVEVPELLPESVRDLRHICHDIGNGAASLPDGECCLEIVGCAPV